VKSNGGPEGLAPDLREGLARESTRWLVTGCAGFIGSHLVEALLRAGQEVVGLDNFATGNSHNLDQVQAAVGADAWKHFRLVRGDIRSIEDCAAACAGAGYVLHQAALGSVPRSLAQPLETSSVNIQGFLNILVAARDAGVRRVVYASSSSVYGDNPDLPKIEDRLGNCLSPYAVSKLVNEQYARVFGSCYGMEVLGLRYFNVFGPRQDPQGAYAAVIPAWMDALIRKKTPRIHGDGETSRDFTYIDNVVEANLRAALANGKADSPRVFNIAAGDRTTLNQLFQLLRDALAEALPWVASANPEYCPFRPGDVRHSQADITRARDGLGYAPRVSVEEGIRRSVAWYVARLGD
jgi:UDP-N-acetylglucosamine 4-epimerase